MAEFAVAFPFALLLVLGIIQLGLMYTAKEIVNDYADSTGVKVVHIVSGLARRSPTSCPPRSQTLPSGRDPH